MLSAWQAVARRAMRQAWAGARGRVTQTKADKFTK